MAYYGVSGVVCGSGSVAGDIQDVAQSLHHGVITHRHIKSYLATTHPLHPRLHINQLKEYNRESEQFSCAVCQLINIIIETSDFTEIYLQYLHSTHE